MNDTYKILQDENIEKFDLKKINDEIIIKNNNNIMNMGSPLYISCINYSIKMVDYLLINGADFKYKYITSNYVDTPFNHCVKLGYIDLVEIFIKHNAIDYEHKTVATYYMLFKDSFIYEYGGYTPLNLSLENNDYDMFTCLLKIGYNNWLESIDDYGLTIIDLIKLKSNENIKYIKYLNKLGIKFEKIVNYKMIFKKYNDTMNEYCKLNSNKLFDIYTKNGIKKIKKHYKSIHKNLSDDSYTIQLNNTSNMVINDKYIKNDIIIINNMCQLWICRNIKEELLNYKKYVEDNYHLNLPYNVRHDNNICNIENYNYSKLIDRFMHNINELIIKYFPGSKKQKLCQSFIIHNNKSRIENFKIHKDDSDFTFNLCIYNSVDLKGSTVTFYENTIIVPTDNDKLMIHTHKENIALLHKGKIWHKSNNLVQGERISLLIWTKNITI